MNDFIVNNREAFVLGSTIHLEKSLKTHALFCESCHETMRSEGSKWAEWKEAASEDRFRLRWTVLQAGLSKKNQYEIPARRTSQWE